MRWCRRWLRLSVTILALTSVPLAVFAVFLVIDTSVGNNYYINGGQLYAEPPQVNSIVGEFTNHYFRPAFYIRRNTTGQPLSEWRSSVASDQLLDIKDFTFIRDATHLCHPTDSPFLVALIHSSPKNFLKRQVIRQTWGSVRDVTGNRVILVFILGIANDTSVQQLVDQEYDRYRDLVVANFADTYRNLTYKHLTGYKWVLNFCNKTQFIMKSDDDSYVDIYRAIKVLRDTFQITSPMPTELPEPPVRNIIACSVFPEGTEPKRSGKWSLSWSEWPYRTFPAYCSGVAYFVTPDVAFDIYEAAHQIKPVLHIDDLFLTGVVTAYLQIHHYPLNMKYAYDHKQVRQWLRDGRSATRQTPNSFMVADIGDVADWRTLMHSLWVKTTRGHT